MHKVWRGVLLVYTDCILQSQALSAYGEESMYDEKLH